MNKNEKKYGEMMFDMSKTTPEEVADAVLAAKETEVTAELEAEGWKDMGFVPDDPEEAEKFFDKIAQEMIDDGSV